MAKVPYVQDDELVEPARGRVHGHPINLYRLLANSPDGLDCFAEIGQWIRYRSVLDPREREIVILAVGYFAKCRYEWSHHVKIGFDFGLSADDIRGVMSAARGEPSPLGEFDLLLIEAARESTFDGLLSDGTWTSLSAKYDDQTMVELLLVLAHYAGVTRLLDSVQMDVEPDYLHFLEEFPLEP